MLKGESNIDIGSGIMRTIKKKYYRIIHPELEGFVSDGKITEE